MIYRVAIKDDQLERARQLEDALNFRLHFGDAVGSRVAALHERALRRIVEQRTLGQRYIGTDASYDDPERWSNREGMKKGEDEYFGRSF